MAALAEAATPYGIESFVFCSQTIMERVLGHIEEKV
uniref:Splicing factor 3b subunit 1 n=1 Tax=Triatoma infestans TaxID=30076 RepID=A0A170UYQ3_TRIIF